MNKNDIMISYEDARQLYSLFRAVESADTIYKSCQSVQFRAFIKATYQAGNVADAFERLNTALTAQE